MNNGMAITAKLRKQQPMKSTRQVAKGLQRPVLRDSSMAIAADLGKQQPMGLQRPVLREKTKGLLA